MFAGGAGFIQSMIVTIRNNKDALRRKSYFERDYVTELSRQDHSNPLIFVKANPEILHAIRSKHATRKKRLGILAFFVVLCAGVFTAHIIQRHQYDATAKLRWIYASSAVQHKQEKVKKTQDYLFYLTEGDQWFSQGHFKNAAHQYEMALWFYPNSSAAKTRLEMTFDVACERAGLFCDEASRNQ